MADIFVSYTDSDREWAFWVGYELDQLGHTAHIHEWEIPGGGDIMAWMEERHDEADRVLCIVSNAYLKKPYSSLERRAAQWAATTSRPNFLLPVFVEPCETQTLFATLKRCDLYGLSEEDARARLTSFLEPAGKPSRRTAFPGGVKVRSASHRFPGKGAVLSDFPIGASLHSTGRNSAPAAFESVPGKNTSDLIEAEFQNSDALITISTSQTILVARPEMALIGFRNLMNRLWAIDTTKDKERILVWILDLGKLDFDDTLSRLKFMNVEALRSRFRALKLFNDSITEARWSWLLSKSVIVLRDIRSVRRYVGNAPAFGPDHVLFSEIPPKWRGSPEFRAMYGREFDRLNETSYTMFLRMSVRMEPAGDVLQGEHGRYRLLCFGHAHFTSDGKDDRQARGLKLDTPDQNYVEALGTVYIAAAQMLGLRSTSVELSVDGIKIDPVHSAEKLRHHGFLLMRLDEFMNF